MHVQSVPFCVTDHLLFFCFCSSLDLIVSKKGMNAFCLLVLLRFQIYFPFCKNKPEAIRGHLCFLGVWGMPALGVCRDFVTATVSAS